MTLAETLLALWRQTLVEERTTVDVDGRSSPVGSTRNKGLRTVSFRVGDRLIEGIEQNPEKDSRWGKLAREGQKVMQFSCNHRYFGVVADGKLTRYPAWKALELSE